MANELSAYDRQARTARAEVARALRSGRLERRPCEECGGPAEAHHHLGYEPEHWLDVQWLCRAHHSQRHFLSSQKWSAVKFARGVPLNRRELRVLRGVTQVELATRLGIAQSNVAAFESRDDVSIGKLREYVAALGGELVLTAVVGDERHEVAIG